VTLDVEGRLVYSAHHYGPNEYRQPWFGASTTPGDLQAVWAKYWGSISDNGIAPVWVGEFGTTHDLADVQSPTPGSQGQWFQALTDWLQRHPDVGWTYWALNGEDRYGLLDSQYARVANTTKQAMLAALQAP
jgi:endoglucanase